jgi:hypothetical protein
LPWRWSEIKLLRRYGIYDASDYEIYLMKEEEILEKMSVHVLSKKSLMTLISDLKHDVAVRAFKKQHKLLVDHQTIEQLNDSGEIEQGKSGKKTRLQSFSQQLVQTISKKHTDKVVDFEEKGTEMTDLNSANGTISSANNQMHVEDAVQMTMKKMFGPSWTPAQPSGPPGGGLHNNTRASASAVLGKWQATLLRASVALVLPTHYNDIELDKDQFRPQPSNKVSIFEVVSADVAQRQFRGNLLVSNEWADFQQSPSKSGSTAQTDSFKRQYGRQSSLEAVKTVNNTVSLEEKLSHLDDKGRVRPQHIDPDEEKRKRHEAAREQVLIDLVKKKLQHAYEEGDSPNKTFFRDVYLFGDPVYYSTFISWVMTGNALYLAWWLTTFTFAAAKVGALGDVLWIFLPLVPAVLTFPLLAMIIKSSTNLKAITEIDLEIVSEVMEKTEEIRKYFNLLRKSLLHRLRLIGMENERKVVSDLFEEVEYSQIGKMSVEDFRRMLVRLQMFLDKPVWMGMFA